MCPHGQRSTPETCSVCMGVAARRVETIDGQVLIDGQPQGRGVDPGAMPPALVPRKHRGKR